MTETNDKDFKKYPNTTTKDNGSAPTDAGSWTIKEVPPTVVTETGDGR